MREKGITLMSPTTFGQIIKGVFLFAYAAFLTASISHVAYFFHSFEPVISHGNWWQEWSGPYALAGSIDVTGLVLTIGVTYMRKGVNGFSLAVIWIFILLLTCFSWIANWEYAQQFATPGLSKSSDKQIFFFPFTFGQLNPVLASSFAFLNLAYSIVADFFNAKTKNAEEIRSEAEQLQAIADATKVKQAAQAVLRDMNDEGRKRWIRGKLEIINEVFPGKKSSESEPSSGGQTGSKGSGDLTQRETLEEGITVPLPFVSPPEKAGQNGDQSVGMHGVKPLERGEQKGVKESDEAGGKTEENYEHFARISLQDPDMITVLNCFPKIEAWLSTGRRTVTIEEIVEATGQSKRKVVNRVNDGTLKRAPRNPKLILISSVSEWLKNAPPPPQNGTIPQEKLEMPPTEKLVETFI